MARNKTVTQAGASALCLIKAEILEEGHRCFEAALKQSRLFFCCLVQNQFDGGVEIPTFERNAVLTGFALPDIMLQHTHSSRQIARGPPSMGLMDIPTLSAGLPFLGGSTAGCRPSFSTLGAALF